MEYQVGQTYELEVVGNEIRKNRNGQDFILVQDGESQYPIYQILKCQYEEELPKTLYVKCTSCDVFGHYRFVQDINRVLSEYYTPGKLCVFEITDIREDNNEHPYYVLEDNFASDLRHYIKGEPKYNIGDNFQCEVVGTNSKGFVEFKEHQMPAPTIEEKQEPQKLACALKDIPEAPHVAPEPESETLEYKTSIVFDPQTNEPNIGKQLYTIVKTMVSFMNTNGGRLIIGVQDGTYLITGIEHDFEHLNDDNTTNFTYKQSEDHYELKIRNYLNWKASGLAGSLVSFSPKSKQGRKYCEITIKPSDHPIWLRPLKEDEKSSLLFVRQGNRIKQLNDDKITDFVMSRLTDSTKKLMIANGLTAVSVDLIDQFKEVAQTLINPHDRYFKDVVPPARRPMDAPNNWCVWYNDSRWRVMKTESQDANVYAQLGIPANIGKARLVFGYKDGHVIMVDLGKYLMNRRTGIQDPAWNTPDKPFFISLAEESDLLVGYSVDEHHNEHVKIHAVTDYELSGETKNKTLKGLPRGKGVSFVPDNSAIAEFHIISAAHKEKVKSLIYPKQDRTRQAGIPLNSASCKEELGYLFKVTHPETKEQSLT